MSPVISRTAAFALTIAVLAFTLLGGVLPTFDRLRAQLEEVEELERQLARFSAADLSAPPTRIEVAEPALIEADSLAQAAAQVQAALDDAVEAGGGTLRSLRIEDAERDLAVWKTPVIIDLDIETEGLQRLLHEIESHRPYLLVERLDARRLRPRSGEEEAGSEASVRLWVIGLMAAPEIEP